MTERRALWLRGVLFGALYTPVAVTLGVAATFVPAGAGGAHSVLESSLRVLGAVSMWSCLFGVPFGAVAGAIATAGYSRWHQTPRLPLLLTVLGAAVGGCAALLFGSLLGGSRSLVVLGIVIGAIGGLLFPRFVAPGAPVPFRKTLLVALSLAVLLMLSQAALWASWIHGEVLLTVSNGQPTDTLVAEIRKVPVNRDPAYMFFSDAGFYCYRVAVYLEPRGGPPISTSCLVLDSVPPDIEVAARWIDAHTLRADIDQYLSVEVLADLYGPSTWRTVRP